MQPTLWNDHQQQPRSNSKKQRSVAVLRYGCLGLVLYPASDDDRPKVQLFSNAFK